MLSIRSAILIAAASGALSNCASPPSKVDFIGCRIANDRVSELAARNQGTLQRQASRVGQQWYDPASFPDAYADMSFQRRIQFDRDVIELSTIKRSYCLPESPSGKS